ncbi:MAG: nuclear transport factor 2 family protein [Terriglobales bacterium]
MAGGRRLKSASIIVALAATLIAAQGCSAPAARNPETQAHGGPRAGPKPTQALHDEIAVQDRILFGAVFDTCDTAALAALIANDFEMVHDKGGLTATSGAQFVASIAAMCARQKTGEDYRARRELVAGSMKVYPIAHYGAIQVGEHRFYQLLPGKPEKLVEIALFTHLWKREGAGWRLARVLSYDHRLVD